MKRVYKYKWIAAILAMVLFVSATNYQTDYFEVAKQIEIFTTLFKELNMNYVDETNPAQLTDAAIRGMLNDLDPYTVFANEQDVETYRMRSSGEFSDIGAAIRRINDRMVVEEVYQGYPADNAGMRPGDEIVQVGDINVSDFKDEMEELLKGAPGTQLKVDFLRQGKKMSATLTRGAVALKAVPYYAMANENTGYIVLTRFSAQATAETRQALENLKAQGAQKIILDLRGNPGGLLNEAVNMVNLFVPKGQLVVFTKSKVKQYNLDYFTKNEPLDTDIPLAILVNGRSASASEIVSGALQDLDRAVIVGSRSFGKGLVQRPKPLVYGTQLKVTISRYYTPSGRCIQALDYWHRDENGKAVRVEDGKQNSFKTKAGRAVYDGGGVLPEIQVKEEQKVPLIEQLQDQLVFFDFATQYYYSHASMPWKNFVLSDSDYEAFKKFVVSRNLEFSGELDTHLEKALGSKENEELGDWLKEDLSKIKVKLREERLKALENHRDQISKELSREIVNRYAYQEGVFEFSLTHDPTIEAARLLLADKKRYDNLLR